LREKVSVWCAGIVARLKDALPALPEALSDRQQDGAEPLLAIADAAGAEWPHKARQALAGLCAGAKSCEESKGEVLLVDIRQVFDEREAERLTSLELAQALAEIETSPWG
jgi:hypothetical protein